MGAGLPGDGDTLAFEDRADVDARLLSWLPRIVSSGTGLVDEHLPRVADFCWDRCRGQVSFYHQQFCAPRRRLGHGGPNGVTG